MDNQANDPEGDLAIGVVIVAYNSHDVLPACLESVLASTHRNFKVVVVDNASQDDTVQALRDWAAGRAAPEMPPAVSQSSPAPVVKPVPVTELDLASLPELTAAELTLLNVLRVPINRGFAGGVNLGLETLAKDPEIRAFWLLNPDGLAMPDTLRALAEAAAQHPDFGLMGGRVLYAEAGTPIQSDGGKLNRWTGMCRSINMRRSPDHPPPAPSELDFINGSHVLASRRFLEEVGPMQEDYFLYYEEVDWAARRGDLPLVYCPEAVIHHHGGTAIGSARKGRRASAFANYFNYRNRLRFMARFHSAALPVAYLYSAAKIVRIVLGGGFAEAWAAALGLHALPPPRGVREKLAPGAAELAFGRGRATRRDGGTEP